MAGVFVRVYNEQPTFSVSDAPAFCKGLVSYLHVQTQSPHFRAAQAETPDFPSEGAKFVSVTLGECVAACLCVPVQCQTDGVTFCNGTKVITIFHEGQAVLSCLMIILPGTSAVAKFLSLSSGIGQECGVEQLKCNAGEGKEKAEDLRRHREHLAAALHALQTLLEAQPRLSAIMASTAALAPFCNCIEPICRQVWHARLCSGSWRTIWPRFREQQFKGRDSCLPMWPCLVHLSPYQCLHSVGYRGRMMLTIDDTVAMMRRRLHELPEEANKYNHGAAARAAAASEQAQHEAEIAALALAILVRLTSHAGAYLVHSPQGMSL